MFSMSWNLRKLIHLAKIPHTSSILRSNSLVARFCTSYEETLKIGQTEEEKVKRDEELAKFSYRELNIRLRTNIGERQSQRLRRKKEFVTGVLQGYAKQDIFVQVPYQVIKEDWSNGHYLTSSKARNTFLGPLYHIKVYSPEEPYEHLWSERAVAKNLKIHPLNEDPVDITFVRAPLSEPVTLRIPIVPINGEKAPGLKEGFIATLMWSVDVVLPPYTAPPKCAIVDMNGMALGSRVLAEDIIVPVPGCRVLCNRNDVVLKIKK